MRIVAGEWRGRTIVAPSGETTRPTADRTRETLFNMLASRMGTFEGLSVADLFAGSGALGLEALSRGCGACLFVEEDKRAVDAIRANVAKLGAGPRTSINQASVTRLGPAKQPHDLIMLDPPYDTNAGPVAIDRLLRLGWIGPATWVSLEVAAAETATVRTMTIEAERKVGKAKLLLLRLRS